MSWTDRELDLVEKASTGKDRLARIDLERLRLDIKEKCKTNRSTSAVRHQVNKFKRPRLEHDIDDVVPETQKDEVKKLQTELEQATLEGWNAKCEHRASLDSVVGQMLKDLDTFAQVDTTAFRLRHKAMLDVELQTSNPQIHPRELLLQEMQFLFVQMLQLERKTKQAELDTCKSKLEEVLHRRDMKQQYQQRPTMYSSQSYYHHPSSSSSSSSSSRRHY